MSREMKEHNENANISVLDEMNPEYQCCCGTMHVRMGSSLIALFAMFGLGINLAYRMSVDNSTVSGIVPLIIGTLAVAALLIGLKTKAQHLFIPFLIVQALGIGTVFALLILCLISLFSDSSSVDGSSEEDGSKTIELERGGDSVSTSLTMSMLTCELLLQLWFINTVWRCYCYFTAVKRHNSTFAAPEDV